MVDLINFQFQWLDYVMYNQTGGFIESSRNFVRDGKEDGGIMACLERYHCIHVLNHQRT